MTSPEATALGEGLAQFFAFGDPKRAPVLRRPDEVGLPYEDVFFPSLDGVPLEGWLIPADSDRLVICNHFMPGNRYGYPGHLEPWTGFGGFEVSFLPQYKALHEAGYNVLAYDLRNFGLSGEGNSGRVGIGNFEYRDVIGSIRYAASHPALRNKKTALLSVCLGANSTIFAIDKHPEEFAHIKALIALQPVSARPFVEQAAARAGIAPEEAIAAFDTASRGHTGFGVDELSPIEPAKTVAIPTLLAQVHDDFLTKPSDVQTIYDNIATADKELHWIQGTDQRFQGYNYFGQNPAVMLAWLDAHFND